MIYNTSLELGGCQEGGREARQGDGGAGRRVRSRGPSHAETQGGPKFKVRILFHY